MVLLNSDTQASFQQQNLTLLKIYSFYQVVLSTILLLTFTLAGNKPLVGQLKPVLFSYSIGSYLLISLFTLTVLLPKKLLRGQAGLFSYFLIDAVFITLLVDASGGLPSGLGVIYIVMVAASSTVLTKQLAILIAAMTSLIILADTFRLISQGYLVTRNFLASGLLGCLLFATALFIQTLSQRLNKSHEQATKSAADARQLERRNQLIVQRMRTGILVSDHQGQIKLQNQAAKTLLTSAGFIDNVQTTGNRLAPSLLNKLRQWQQNPQHTFPADRNNNTGPELQINFTALNDGQDTETLMFIEDNRQLAQRAQQIKLASLGRLTASIAHEIRNPLSAISHAAQLLSESPALDKCDQRLSEIIQNHTRRMDQIIENVLQLSRRKHTEPEQIELQAWLQEFVEEYTESNQPDAQITIQSALPRCPVTIDTSHLRQVLVNLIANGLRYSKQQTGQATMTLSIGSDSSNQLPYLDLIDDGPGIEQSLLEQLFEPFYTTEASGTGLGLFISRELCESNQARLNYHPSPDGKSCFRISFPHPDRRIDVEERIKH